MCIYWDNRKGVRVKDVRHIWPNEKMLEVLREEVTSWGTADALLAVEVPCYVNGGRSIINTILWTGHFEEAWEREGGKVRRIERHQVYKHVCPGTKGCDAAVRRGLIARFGPPGTKKKPGRTYGITSHMWAALGVAVTAAETKEG